MGLLKMNNGLLMGKNAQSISKKEEHPCKRGYSPTEYNRRTSSI